MPRPEKTRTALLTAAMELFAERGYDATTTAEIARRAGVSEMTLFRHFPTKSALVVDDPYDPVIASAIEAQHPSLSALAAAAAGVADAWRSLPQPDVAAVRERLRIVASTPSLTVALAGNSRATEEAIAAALRSRGTHGRTASIAAAATIAALNAALLAWAQEDDAPLGDAILTAVRVLEGGAT